MYQVGTVTVMYSTEMYVFRSLKLSHANKAKQKQSKRFSKESGQPMKPAMSKAVKLAENKVRKI